MGILQPNPLALPCCYRLYPLPSTAHPRALSFLRQNQSRTSTLREFRENITRNLSKIPNNSIPWPQVCQFFPKPTHWISGEIKKLALRYWEAHTQETIKQSLNNCGILQLAERYTPSTSMHSHSKHLKLPGSEAKTSYCGQMRWIFRFPLSFSKSCMRIICLTVWLQANSLASSRQWQNI